jgi:nucleoside-triphosphatase THEP1
LLNIMRILPILLSENCVQIGAILMEKQGFDGQKVGFAIQMLAESYTVGTMCYTDVSRKLYSWYHVLYRC